MPTTQNAPLFFVDDSCLLEYEAAVYSIARGRVLNFLFPRSGSTLSEILSETHISLNSLAAVFIELNQLGVLLRTENGIAVTDFGRRWIAKNRNKLFMQRHKVLYAPPREIPRSTVAENGTKKLPRGYLFPS